MTQTELFSLDAAINTPAADDRIATSPSQDAAASTPSATTSEPAQTTQAVTQTGGQPTTPSADTQANPTPTTGQTTAQPTGQPNGQATGQPAAQNGQHQVPLAVMLEERAAAKQAMQEAAQARAELALVQRQVAEWNAARQQQSNQPQQLPPRPDPLMDPEGAARWDHAVNEMRVNRMREELEGKFQQELQQRDQTFQERAVWDSHQRAVAQVGADVVRDATKAVVEAGLKNQFRALPDPTGAAVQWYRNQQFRSQYGNDPEQIRTRLREEMMADPAFVEQVAQKLRTGSSPPAVIPPSLSNIPRAHTAQGVMGSPSEFLADAINRR